MSLRDVFEAEKFVAEFVGWRANAADLTFLQPLDLAGVTQEGLYLRASAKRFLPQQVVVLQLESHRPGKRSGGQLERICWNPLGSHPNPWRGPEELQGLEIDGSHFHDFYLNYKEAVDEMKMGNLKIARQILPNPQNWQELIDFSGKRFNISNLKDIPEPPWENDLFGGEL